MTSEQGAPGVRAGGSLPLPRPPGALRRFGHRHPRVVDWAVVVATQLPIAIVAIVAASFEEAQRAGAILGLATSVAAGAALLWRRRHPLLVVIACSALVLVPSDLAIGAALAIYVAVYSAGAYARTSHVWISVAIASVASMVSTFLPSDSVDLSAGPIVYFNLVGVATYVVAALVGTSAKARRTYVAALIARADDMARDRDREAQLAVAAERARIAREMHDVVSHGLTVMVTLAEGSAAQASRDPDRAAATMRRVADAGRDSLAEMRRLLGVLRQPGDAAERAPQPVAADLQGLVASFRETGMPVRLTTAGASIDDATLALAVHRIVQEGLTNAMRHASDAGRVEVDVRHGSGVVRIEIVDDGSGAPASITGAGRGLVGMRERAALFGGDVVAGPREPSGWRIVATLHESTATEQEQPA